MKRLVTNRYFLLAVRLLLGGIFAYAGIVKISDPLALADSIATYQIVPMQLINLLALGLPPLEILAGVMLMTGCKARKAALCLIFLSLVFCAALIQGLARGLVIDCGCFGGGEPSMLKTIMAFGRDVLLVIGGVLVYCGKIPCDNKN